MGRVLYIATRRLSLPNVRDHLVWFSMTPSWRSLWRTLHGEGVFLRSSHRFLDAPALCNANDIDKKRCFAGSYTEMLGETLLCCIFCSTIGSLMCVPTVGRGQIVIACSASVPGNVGTRSVSYEMLYFAPSFTFGVVKLHAGRPHSTTSS